VSLIFALLREIPNRLFETQLCYFEHWHARHRRCVPEDRIVYKRPFIPYLSFRLSRTFSVWSCKDGIKTRSFAAIDGSAIRSSAASRRAYSFRATFSCFLILSPRLVIVCAFGPPANPRSIAGMSSFLRLEEEFLLFSVFVACKPTRRSLSPEPQILKNVPRPSPSTFPI